ncbi:MAG: site-2 protease family protein [Anaerolineae bacterium]
MSLFQAPQPTQLDLKFRIFGFNVRVHPLFWLIAILFGSSSGSLSRILSWVIAVFVSILVHELGHTFAMRYYGQDSHIVLHGFGGLAIPLPSFGYKSGGPRTPWHQIFISFAGPLAGFLLAAVICLVIWAVGGTVFFDWLFNFIPRPIAFLPSGYSMGDTLVNDFLWINTFWGLINLLPVFPLDGGRIARELFILSGDKAAIVNSLWLSVITGGLLALLAMVYLNSIYMALLFGILAFQSYGALQRG